MSAGPVSCRPPILPALLVTAVTGSAVIWILLASMVLLAGDGLFVWTIRRDTEGREDLYAVYAQPVRTHALGEDQDDPDGRRYG